MAIVGHSLKKSTVSRIENRPAPCFYGYFLRKKRRTGTPLKLKCCLNWFSR